MYTHYIIMYDEKVVYEINIRFTIINFINVKVHCFYIRSVIKFILKITDLLEVYFT